MDKGDKDALISKIINRIKENSTVVIMLIVILGFVLRLIGFTWGAEGATYHPDEVGAMQNLESMFNQHSYLCSLWIYPSMCTSKLIAGISMVIDLIEPLSQLDLFYIARFFYVLMSTFTIWLSYVLVKRIEGEKLALFFAFMISIYPPYVRFSKMVVGDTPVLMFWLLVALFGMYYCETKKERFLIIATIFASCATVEKWNGAAICFHIAFIVIYTNIKEKKYFQLIKHGLISFLVWAFFVVVLAPNIFAERSAVLADIKEANGFGVVKPSSLLNAHPQIFLTYYGIGATVLILFGLWTILRDGKISKRVPYGIAIIQLLVEWLITFQLVERHGLAIYWAMTLLLVLGMHAMKRGLSDKIGRFIPNAIICIIVISSLVASARVDLLAAKTDELDSRVRGLSMLEDLGANCENTVADAYTPLRPGGIRETGEVQPCSISAAFYVDGDGMPCSIVPDIQFVVLGGYWDREGRGYDTVRAYGAMVGEIDSQYTTLDMFHGAKGCGSWNSLELDTIKKTWRDIEVLLKGETIGPYFKVYDISHFKYVPQDE